MKYLRVGVDSIRDPYKLSVCRFGNAEFWVASNADEIIVVPFRR